MARRLQDDEPRARVDGMGMFHRRVLLLVGAFLVGLVLLSSQVVRLSVVEGAERLDAAMRRLDRTDFLPTVRGSILDRKGRVLAQDRPSDDLAANFEFLSGVWAVRRAGESARRRVNETSGRAAWLALPPAARQEEILRDLPAWDAEVERIWQRVAELTGIDREEIERRLDEIRESVHRQALAVADRRRALEIERLAAGDADAPPPPQGPILAQRSSHLVLLDLEDEAAIELARLAEKHPGTLELRRTVRRVQPWARVDAAVDRRDLPSPIRAEATISVEAIDPLGMIVGRVGEEVWKEDVSRRPFRREDGSIDLGGNRLEGERIGRSGVEAAFEDRLRGRRGLVRRSLTEGELERIEPVRGDDVVLSIDASLQSRLAALLAPEVGLAVPQQWHAGWEEGVPRAHALPPDWKQLQGAIVVVDVETGEVLAAVSSPSPEEVEDWSPWRREVADPMVQRALEGVYPPGSILKPIVYASAVAAGALAADAAIECTGHFFPNLPEVARCWIYRERFGLTTHSLQVGGPLGVEEAIARSCNIYFYEVAARLGPRRLVEWLRRFGLDRPFGVGLGWQSNDRGSSPRGEHAGVLPEPEDLEAIRSRGDRVTPILLGIGQGPIAWTPLHAANAFAILARGGAVLDPTILRVEGSREPSERLPLPRSAVDRALEGLRRAVADPVGTGHHLTLEDGSQEPLIAVPGITTWGKTGTAQATPLAIDRDQDGRRETRLAGLEHAWFVGLVGEEGRAPRWSIAVVLEHAGSGGRAAGPLAAAVIRALIAEGYLRGAPPPSSGGAT